MEQLIVREEQLKRARALLKKSEFVELVSVLEGIKPGMCLCCTGKQAADLSELTSELNLFKSESTYAVKDEIAAGEFVHTWRGLPKKPGREDRRFVYIGADRFTVGLLKAFDAKDNRRFGLSLGYPECCVNFFTRNFSRIHFDLVPEIGLSNGRGYRPFLNCACRHFDYRLLSYFPCSWDCESSYRLAGETLQALRRHDPELARETLYWLESDVVYSPEMVIAVKNTPREGNILSLRKDLYRITGKLEADMLRFENGAALLLKGKKTVAELKPYQWLPFQSEQRSDGNQSAENENFVCAPEVALKG